MKNESRKIKFRKKTLFFQNSILNGQKKNNFANGEKLSYNHENESRKILFRKKIRFFSKLNF